MSRLPRINATLVALVVLAGVAPGHATSIVQLDFDKLVADSEIVVEGIVVGLHNQYIGTDIRQAKSKVHTPPASIARELDGTARPAPQSVGIEGGKMLFTEVTLSLGTETVGSAGSTVTFRVAGGSDGRRTVTVFGMPQFALGERYVVFLRRGFAATGAPIVGVNQGYFQVVKLPDTGRQALLNADGDILLGIQNNRFVTRRNQERATRSAPNLVDPPIPAPGSSVTTGVSKQARQYWSSNAEPMALESLMSAVRAAKGDTP